MISWIRPAGAIYETLVKQNTTLTHDLMIIGRIWTELKGDGIYHPFLQRLLWSLMASIKFAARHWWQNVFIWWRHQMEPFSALLALCAGNSPVPGNSPHKGQWHRALMFSLICAWINDWVNNREAGDLRRHRGHYDVIVMNLLLRVSRGGNARTDHKFKNY